MRGLFFGQVEFPGSLGQRIVYLLSFSFPGIIKSKTGGSRPARRLTFVHAATKVSKNALLLAEGYGVHGPAATSIL
jgi:hypothetical protein